MPRCLMPRFEPWREGPFNTAIPCSGFRNGWAGLLDSGDTEPLTPRVVSGILHIGGTILGTSRTNPLKRPEDLQQVLENLRRVNIDALVAIGGDDTLSVAARLSELGCKVVGVPKDRRQ